MASVGMDSASPDIQMDMSGNPEKSTDMSTEQFLMYGYKVVQCSKRYRHDWSVCPFAHTGEMAARRDPSRYLPIFCFHSKQRLPCPRGEECMYSHNLFEYWLHPQRYRTEMCQFGANCSRPVCFFAHGEHQLRHTSMPGGAQPVVGPPEPLPGLGGSYNSRELGGVSDPAVKQQQQLLALHAAAAGFSSGGSQVRSDLLPVVEHSHQLPPAGHGYGGLLNGGGSMDMAALASQLGGSFSAGSFSAGSMPGASAPLSAPLPGLSPDLLAALSQLSGGGGGGPPPGGLMHQGSGIPASFGSQVPGRGGGGGGFPGAGPLLTATSNPVLVDELAKQLAVMQLMQAQGANSSAPLPQLSNVDEVLGQLAHMHQQQRGEGGGHMSLEELLGAGCSTPMHLAQDTTSFSCPLPPVYSNSALADLLHGPPAVSASLPRGPSPAAGLAPRQQHYGSSNGLAGLAGGPPSHPPSPGASETGRDAPSPGPAAAPGRDTSDAGGGARGGGQQHPWSAPVSPATSARGGAEPGAAGGGHFKLSSISFSAASSSAASSSSSGSAGRLVRLASEGNLSAAERGGPIGLVGNGMPSLSGGMGPDAAPLLLVGERSLAADDVAAAITGAEADQQPGGHHGHEAGGLRDQRGGGAKGSKAGAGGMGEEMAVKLLAALPEDSVKKLLDLVAQQGA